MLTKEAHRSDPHRIMGDFIVPDCLYCIWDMPSRDGVFSTRWEGKHGFRCASFVSTSYDPTALFHWIANVGARHAVPLRAPEVCCVPVRVERGSPGTACRAPTGGSGLLGHGVPCPYGRIGSYWARHAVPLRVGCVAVPICPITPKPIKSIEFIALNFKLKTS